MSALTKTRRVYTLRSLRPFFAIFEHEDYFDLPVDVATYDDFGRPSAITVTIEPGDLLNGGEIAS